MGAAPSPSPFQVPARWPKPGFGRTTLMDRFHEVDAETRSIVRDRAAARLAEGRPTETYRRLAPGEALRLLWTPN